MLRGARALALGIAAYWLRLWHAGLQPGETLPWLAGAGLGLALAGWALDHAARGRLSSAQVWSEPARWTGMFVVSLAVCNLGLLRAGPRSRRGVARRARARHGHSLERLPNAQKTTTP